MIEQGDCANAKDEFSEACKPVGISKMGHHSGLFAVEAYRITESEAIQGCEKFAKMEGKCSSLLKHDHRTLLPMVNMPRKRRLVLRALRRPKNA